MVSFCLLCSIKIYIAYSATCGSLLNLQILEKLYDPNHIVIGNELVKLASIQLSLGDSATIDTIEQVDAIFSQYYGSHANIILPQLEYLKREAIKLTAQ